MVVALLLPQGEGRIPIAAPAYDFEEGLRELRTLDSVEGARVGCGGRPGRFFVLSRDMIRFGSREDFERMLADENPVVRCMGLACFAGREDLPDRVSVLRRRLVDGDFLGHGEIGHESRPLLSAEEADCLDLELLASVRGGAERLPIVWMDVEHAVGDRRIRHEPGRIESPCGRISDIDVINAVGRTSGLGSVRGFLVASLADPLLSREARLAAASALARDLDEAAFEALADAEPFLLGTQEGESILRRRWDSIRLRENLRAFDLATAVDEAVASASPWAQSHPWAFEPLVSAYLGEASVAPKPLKRTFARSLLAMSHRLEECAAPWDADGVVPFRIMAFLRKGWGKDLLRFLDERERAALTANLERYAAFHR